MKLTCGVAAAIAVCTLAASPASAEPQPAPYVVKPLTFDVTVAGRTCRIDADLYTPRGVSRARPAPAVLTTNGYGGSKGSQKPWSQALARRGYVVLSYSGLGWGNSGCAATFDDREHDGAAASQLISFLGGGKGARDGTWIDYVRRDARGHDGRMHPHDPRVGMIGGSYGGHVQFATAAIDPRLDTIIPIVTWHDLAYAFAPNDATDGDGQLIADTPGSITPVGLRGLVLGGALSAVLNPGPEPLSAKPICRRFDPRWCELWRHARGTTPGGVPSPEDLRWMRGRSLATYADQVRIPTFLIQGQHDTLISLRHSVAAYRALTRAGTPVKLAWMSAGHSGGYVPGEFDTTLSPSSWFGRVVDEWFGHYLRDEPAAPALDFSYFRDWVDYRGDATQAFASAPAYPAASATADYALAGDDLHPANAARLEPSRRTLRAGPPELLSDTPRALRYLTPPLERDTDVVGVGSLDLQLQAPRHEGASEPAQQLTLYVSLYDLGSGLLARPEPVPEDGMIAAVRIADPTKPVRIQLPGLVHRFRAGHRIVVRIASSDPDYIVDNQRGDVTIGSHDGARSTLRLPVVR